MPRPVPSSTITPAERRELEEIARVHLDLPTLETRNSGADDFSEHAVWCIRAALEAAFEAGKRSHS